MCFKTTKSSYLKPNVQEHSTKLFVEVLWNVTLCCRLVVFYVSGRHTVSFVRVMSPRRKLNFLIGRTNWLMLLREVMGIYCETPKDVYSLRGQSVGFLSVTASLAYT
jgi:hypothetical protein